MVENNMALSFFGSWQLRALVRTCAFIAVIGTVLHGAARNGEFESEASSWNKIPGRLASMAGMAADDIQIAGLDQHDPAEIMSALGVKPGSSLVGFDANNALAALEQVPWVKSASVAREYPNALRIAVSERKAIALWQHGPDIDLVDDSGRAMGQPKFVLSGQLPLVTGLNANLAAADLINQMSAIPGLSQRVTAAARVGGRRWTLYLDSGVKVALPEEGVAEALKAVWDVEQSQALLSKGINLVDMRIPGRMTLQIAEIENAESPSSKGAVQK